MNNDNKYIKAFNLIIEDVQENINHAVVKKLLYAFSAEGTFPNVFSILDNKITTIEQDSEEFMKIFVWQLLSGLSDKEEQEVIAVMKKTFTHTGIKSDHLLFENRCNISQQDIDLIKGYLPTESDIDDAFDKLLDLSE